MQFIHKISESSLKNHQIGQQHTDICHNTSTEPERNDKELLFFPSRLTTTYHLESELSGKLTQESLVPPGNLLRLDLHT